VSLWERAAAVQSEQGDRDAIDLVFNEIDDLLIARKFAEVDAILAEALALKPRDIQMLIAFLSITWAARNLLRKREELFRWTRAVAEQDDPTRAEALLSGLE
jgi:hypothetical protein